MANSYTSPLSATPAMILSLLLTLSLASSPLQKLGPTYDDNVPRRAHWSAASTTWPRCTRPLNPTRAWPRAACGTCPARTSARGSAAPRALASAETSLRSPPSHGGARGALSLWCGAGPAVVACPWASRPTPSGASAAGLTWASTPNASGASASGLTAAPPFDSAARNLDKRPYKCSIDAPQAVSSVSKPCTLRYVRVGAASWPSLGRAARGKSCQNGFFAIF